MVLGKKWRRRSAQVMSDCLRAVKNAFSRVIIFRPDDEVRAISSLGRGVAKEDGPENSFPSLWENGGEVRKAQSVLQHFASQILSSLRTNPRMMQRSSGGRERRWEYDNSDFFSYSRFRLVPARVSIVSAILIVYQ